jgi:hypothetical protein
MSVIPSISQNGVGVVAAGQLNAYQISALNTATLRSLTGQTGMTAYLQGTYVPNDGGQGVFWWNYASVAPDNNSSVIVPYGATAGAWNRMSTASSGTVTGDASQATVIATGSITAISLANRFALLTSVDDFGATGNGTTDDTAAVNAAIAVAAATGAELYFPPGTYKITSRLTFDISKFSVRGDSATLDGSTSTNGLLRVYGTQSYPADERTNITHSISGIYFKGSNTAGKWLVQIGETGAAYVGSEDILFDSCAFAYEGTLISFVDNAWRTKFVNCSLIFPLDYYMYFNRFTTTNSGEVMVFEKCWMVNGDTAYIYINGGQFYFNNCSFPGGGVGLFQILGDAHVVVSHSNIETQPGASASQRLFNVSGSALCVIDGCTWVFNGGPYYIAPVLANDYAGVKIKNCTIPFWGTDIQSQVTDGIKGFVYGNSPYISFSDNYITGTGAPNQNTIACAGQASSILYNGNAETNSTAGWTAVTYGTAGSTVVASTSAAKNGTYGFRMTCVATGGVNFSQTLNVGDAVGRTVLVGMWARAVAGTGVVSYPDVYFYAADGTQITTLGTMSIDGSATTWAWVGAYGVVPPGTNTIKMNLNGQSLAAGCTIDFDSIILNVI